MARDSQRRRVGIDSRAQSVFDFSIGVSLFVVVVLGVLLFVPTAFGAFTGDSGGGVGDGLAADKAATYLAESALAAEAPQPTLDSECTLLFFTGTNDRPDIGVGPSDCGFEQGAPLASNATLAGDRINLNVTIERRKPTDPGRQRLCWDADAGLSDDRLVPVGDSDCTPSSSDDVRLTAGASAANNEPFAVTERYGRLADQGVYLVVRTW